MNDTDFLYARPSFIEGVARLFDTAGSLNEYNRSPTPEEADARALSRDTIAVARDLLQVIVEEAPTVVKK